MAHQADLSPAAAARTFKLKHFSSSAQSADLEGYFWRTPLAVADVRPGTTFFIRPTLPHLLVFTVSSSQLNTPSLTNCHSLTTAGLDWAGLGCTGKLKLRKIWEEWCNQSSPSGTVWGQCCTHHTTLGLEAGLNPFEMKMTQISWLAELTRNCCVVSDPSLHQGNPTLSNFGP